MDEDLFKFRVHFLAAWSDETNRRRQFNHLVAAKASGIDLSAGAPPLEGQLAYDAAARGYDSMIRKLAPIASNFSRLRWTWLLRMLPYEAFGRGGDGGRGYMYRRVMIESLANLHGAPTAFHPADGHGIAYPNKRDWDTISEFCGLARVAANFDEYRVEAARGVPLIFERDNGRVWMDTTSARFSDSKTFRDRSAQYESLGAHSGIAPPLIGSEQAVGRAWPIHVVASRPYADLASLRVSTVPWWPPDFCFMYAREWSELPLVLRPHRWYSPDVPVLLFVMNVVMPALVRSESRMGSVARLGFVVLERDRAVQEIGATLQSGPLQHLGDSFPLEDLGAWTAESILQALEAPPELRPQLAGPAAHMAGDRVCLDFAAASRRLLHSLAPGQGGGAMPNARASHFERNIQDMIDDTEWWPPRALRERVGKQLKRSDRSYITDVDAIAAKGSTVILIDAKSYVRLSALSGDWNAIRKLREKLEGDVADWNRKIDDVITENCLPLTGYTSVERLIVTAAPHFVHGDLLEFAVLDGRLRPAASYDELKNVLAST